jgi:hypothetical protein
MKGPGNPAVFKEAEDRKKGGKCRATGGSVSGVGAASATKTIGRMSGGAVKARLDRPGRKKGGRVGSNNAPLSTANAVVSAPKAPGNNADAN